MKNIKWFYLYASLLTLAIVGCTHPSEPASTPPTVSELYGSVFYLDTTRSNFDTSIWEPATGIPVHLLNPDTVAQTNASAYYGFYHIKATDPTLTVSQPGFASVSVFHAGKINSYPEPPGNLPTYYSPPFNILLTPNSWLSVTIDNFEQNFDTSIVTKRIGVQTDAQGDTTNYGTLITDTEIDPEGLYTIAHIHSMRADKPSLGYVSLYISTKPNIDPTDTSTYDVVFGHTTSPQKDSAVRIEVWPGMLEDWGQVGRYKPGTTVYCKAYAYPFPHLPEYFEAHGNKPIYNGLGEYPSNTTTFTIP